MKKAIINGIQQIGIGCDDATAVFDWYRRTIGFDIKVFEDEAKANLMTDYTGGKVRSRHAILAMNMIGGGGLEIWQYTDHKPQPPRTDLQLGDLGINILKIRSKDIQSAHAKLLKGNLDKVSAVNKTPEGISHFYFIDPWNNWVEVLEDDYIYSDTASAMGGVTGAVVGVSDMEKSIRFYGAVLGYEVKVYDVTNERDDWADTASGKSNFRSVLLRPQPDSPRGGFCNLLGPTEIELVQSLDRTPNVIYKDRHWGDLGYIHICFDVNGMNTLRDQCEQFGSPFVVDSADSFDMGDAAGHFTYVEDPDGTLIEFVETHKVPILKKLGIFINLKKRDPKKPLPNWLIKSMRIHRVKG